MSVKFPEVHVVSDLLRDLVHEIVVPLRGNLGKDDVHYKDEGSPVTTADRVVEERLSAILPGICAGSYVVGEEGVANDSAILDKANAHDLVWLVDPVDGTRNFVNGSEDFCSMLALLYKGQTIMSWIYLPCQEKMAIAVQGDGAEFGGEPLHTAQAFDDPGIWQGQLNFNIFPQKMRDIMRVKADARYGERKNLHCAGLDFLYLAQGARQFTLYRKLWPWDHAPGILLLREAGGHMGMLQGYNEYRAIDRVEGMLSCVNKNIWDDVANFVTVAQELGNQ